MTSKLSANQDLKVSYRDDCGNAPRKKILLDFNVAFAKGDLAFVLEHVTDNVLWERVGNDTIQGKEQLIKAMQQLVDHQATELCIANIITHGYTAAANGTITYGEKRYSFCDVYVFNGASKHAKIKSITTYAIDLT